MEALSRAYVFALAARCGLTCNARGMDYGIDLCLNEVRGSGNRYSEAGVQLDVQLRNTTLARISATEVSYDLDVRTYDDLREVRARVPRILVVYVFPEDEAEWLTWSEEQLVLRRSAYWVSMVGRPAVVNTRSIRLAIPRANQFSVEGLQAIMSRLREGGSP